MDNKITKTRLNNYFSYEWIAIVIFIVVSCLLWEFVYSALSVKPTLGQEFKYYYDVGLYYDNAKSFHTLIEDNGTFSYDVLFTDHESIQERYETLSLKLRVGEGDIIFTDSTLHEESKPDNKSKMDYARARNVIDNYPVYPLDQLLKDASDYLKGYLKDGVAIGAELNYGEFEQNFDMQKIENGFIARLGKDNRFRTDEQKQLGILLEKQRIQKLVKDASDFKYFLDNAPEESFYNYTKYEEVYFSYKDLGPNWQYYIDRYKTLYDAEVAARQNVKYGINLETLTGGRRKTSTYFKVVGNADAKNVVMMAFNFKTEQPDLQYETISFMATILREFGSIIPA